LAPPRIASARRPARLVATLGAVCALAVGLAACGDSSSGSGGFRNSAQGEKIRKALQKCGVTLPNRGQNGPPQQQQDATPGDTTAS
jgi:hypothetical protein